ncbi:MAG: leucine-rich repeat domain-containing protein [Methanomassiliicoccales archaeon]
MRRFTRQGVSPIIATTMMVVITIVLSAVVVVMVMSYNSSGGSARYGSFAQVERNSNDQYTLYFGAFTPQTRFSEVKASIAGQLIDKPLSDYSGASSYSSSQVAYMYPVDLGGEGKINVGDSLVIKFGAIMAGGVVDVLIILSASGDAIAGTSLVVGATPTPPPVAGDYIYTVSAGKATISTYIGAGGAITLPSTALGGYRNGAIIATPYPVVAIGGAAFLNCTSLTSVTMSSSITSIGGAAFQGCTALASMTISGTVASIGNSAFQACTALTAVSIPNGVISLGNRAFYVCTALTSVAMGSGVASIGAQAFQGCTALASLGIGGGVISIGNNAFQACTALISVSIPNRVSFIDSNAFYQCAALTAVTMGTGVTTINTSVFYGCTALTSIYFLGLARPTTVGTNWIGVTPASLRGHAYAASDFPPPWTIIGDPTFNGLKMGTHIA